MKLIYIMKPKSGLPTQVILLSVFIFLLFFQLLIFPSQCLRAVGDSKESTTFAGSLCCRLLASALIGTCTFQMMMFCD